jgi:hypothetical protein
MLVITLRHNVIHMLGGTDKFQGARRNSESSLSAMSG